MACDRNGVGTVDGSTAVQVLVRLKQLVEEPESLLRGA